jgi:peptidoglycan hydrolase-like protein with peptidoglycan-binding domain
MPDDFNAPKLKSQGAAVKELHVALQKLGFQLAADEVQTATFGPATFKAVFEFQQRNGLSATGEVDEKTALEIKRLLDSPPGDPVVVTKPFMVRGQVSHSDGQAFHPGMVRAFDRDLRSEELLGEVALDAKGGYEIRYGPDQFQRAEKQRADVFVTVSNSDGLDVAKSATVFNAKDDTEINISLESKGARGPSEFEVLIADLKPVMQGLPLADLQENDDHQDVTFLEGETGHDPIRIAFLIQAHRLMKPSGLPAEVFYGMFREGLPWDYAALVMQDTAVKRAAIVRAAEKNVIPERFGKDVDGFLKPFTDLAVNVALEKEPVDKTLATLPRLMATVLENRDDQQAFLAAYATNNGPISAFWEKIEADPKLKAHVEPMQFAFQLGALTLNHLPLVLELQQAVKAKKLTVGDTAISFSGLRDLTRLAEHDWVQLIQKPVSGSPLGVPTNLPGRDDAAKVRHYARILAYQIEDTFPTEFATRQLEKDDLSGRDDLLVFLKANPDFDVRTQRLTHHLKDKPNALADVQDVEGTKRQVQAMTRLYSLSPRYSHVSAMLKDGLNSALSISGQGQNAFVNGYAGVMGAGPALAVHQDAKFKSDLIMTVASSGGLIQSVSMNVLAGTSASTQVSVPEWSTLFGSLELCGCEHCRSVYSPAAYLVDMLGFLEQRDADPPARRPTPAPTPAFTFPSVKDALFQRRPDLGEIELTCQNTNTVLPYVDLVNEILENTINPFRPFTLEAGLEATLNARVVSGDLKTRFAAVSSPLTNQAKITLGHHGRPVPTFPQWTIEDTDFTYIVQKVFSQLTVQSRSFQTKGSNAERAANPQYTNEQAYTTLEASVYPWQAPFSRSLEEARTYLEHLGTSRAEILEAFKDGTRKDVLEDQNLALETLSLSVQNAKLIRGNFTQPSWEHWGFKAETLTPTNSIPDPADRTQRITAGNWLAVLAGRVDVFLHRANLTYRELLGLLETRFINKEKSIKIVPINASQPDDCAPKLLKLEGLDEAAAKRVVQFLRLWRTLGWSMQDLDRVIVSFAAMTGQRRTDFPNLNRDDFVVWLSHIKRLGMALDLPVIRVLSMLNEIDHTAYVDHTASNQPLLPSLYEQLFRNKLVSNPLDAAFVEDATQIDIRLTLSDHAATITAALEISQDDFNRLTQSIQVVPIVVGGTPIANPNLSLDTLSRLYKHSLLAKQLELSIPEYLIALELMDAELAAPVFGLSTNVALFIERVKQVQNAGFTFTELDYLLRHREQPSSGVKPGEETIAPLLTEWRAVLAKIKADNTLREDPDGTLTRQKLTMLGWDSRLIDQIIATLNDSITYETPLARLPQVSLPTGTRDIEFPNFNSSYQIILDPIPTGYTIPEELQAVVRYDTQKKLLVATRRLSDDEIATLRNSVLAPGPLLDAINALEMEPDALQGTIRFEDGKLFFTGVMNEVRFARLVSLSSDGTYRQALEKLAGKPTRFLARALVRFSNTCEANLTALPSIANFPPEALKNKFFFDKPQKKLRFIGAMTEEEKTLLDGLSSEPLYRQAINDLWGSPDITPNPNDPGIIFLFDQIPDLLLGTSTAPRSSLAPTERFGLLLKRLLPHLERTQSERLLSQKIADTLQLEVRTAQGLLTKWLHLTISGTTKSCMDVLLEPDWIVQNQQVKITEATTQNQFTAFRHVHKTAMIVGKFGLNHRQITWLFEFRLNGPWLDLDRLPINPSSSVATSFAGWSHLASLVELRDVLPNGEKTLAALIEPEQASLNTTNVLSQWTRWPIQDNLDALIPTTRGYPGETVMRQVHACMKLVERLGLSAKQIQDHILKATLNATDSSMIVRAARAKHDEAGWLNVSKPLRDQLRKKQRAALVAYLVVHANLAGRNIIDSNDLYEYLLIDVEMDPCMMTSRIKQALSSVQLFVQRCQMALESEVKVNAERDDAWLQWKWMKNYRVWEANRKVFLYPENWIEPELRDDKSAFFTELESELLQSDLNLETAEIALTKYLEKLDQVARLEIMGVLEDRDAATKTVHVFARTYSSPHVYFYRQQVDRHWTAWERLDLDIEGNHLIPVVWNGRLYLYWPIFTERALEVNPTISGGNLSGVKPEKYWEYKIAWSERKNGKWSSKRTSKSHEGIPNPPRHEDWTRNWSDAVAKFPYSYSSSSDLETIRFSHEFSGGRLHIRLHRHAAPTFDKVGFGRFYFPNLRSEPKFDRQEFTLQPDRLPILRKFNWLTELNYGPGVLPQVDLLLGPDSDTPVIVMESMDIKGKYKLMLPLENPGETLSTTIERSFVDQTGSPLFYMDDERNYFITSRVVDTSADSEISAALSDLIVDVEVVNEVATSGRQILQLVTPRVKATGGVAKRFPIQPVFLTPNDGTVDMRFADARNFPIRFVAQAISIGGGSLPFGNGFPGGGLLGDRGGGGPTDGNTIPFTVLTERPPDPIGLSGRARSGLEFRYQFHIFYHPFVTLFVNEMNLRGVNALMRRELQLATGDLFTCVSRNGFRNPPNVAPPGSNPFVEPEYPTENVDYSFEGAYSHYNWELFFHAPLLIADRLSQNQRFEEAQRWFHFIFNPTDTSSASIPNRYWQVGHFFKTSAADYENQRIEALLKTLAKLSSRTASALTSDEQKELDHLRFSVAQWRKNPFKPHLVARTRTVAYQKTVVMKYIDNLIAWGDQLFRRDTIESINEAAQLYILAANILGHKPEDIPARKPLQSQTYNSLKPTLDDFRNSLVNLEEVVPTLPASGLSAGPSAPALTLGTMLYFCVPQNDKLLGYWDTVADRLFKIRHCMNIEGVVRQLPLFEPPIDPALLVKATAAGVDLGSVLNEVNGTMPRHRFSVMIQKASELCAELKSLGSNLLSALEKKDGEALSILRTTQETTMLELALEIKQKQLDEAVENLNATLKTRETTGVRFVHYQKLLGNQNPQIPAEGQAWQDIAGASQVVIKDEAGVKIIPLEKEEMNQLEGANSNQNTAAEFDFSASIAHIVPNWNVEPWGMGATFGGSNVGSALGAFAARYRSDAGRNNQQAAKSAKIAQLAFRAHDNTLQANLAGREFTQIDKQLAAARIRIEVASKEINNHRKQIENSKTVEAFMRDKYTNQELYSWMVGQLSTVYFQMYQLAYDVAKRSERAYRFELGLTNSNFVQFGYWDSLKKGLMAGEKLHHDLKRMEVTYLEQNRREYEITKHVSISRLNPMALLELRETGECFVTLPEALFDLDYPGHFMRRLKSVSISIPCVTGPYTSVNCTLTLLRSGTRRVSEGTYPRTGPEDNRFVDDAGAIQSIVTSTGQNDSGLFETNLRDERFLPFEGAGAISEWRIELPKEFRAFDYNTISDVILHLRYTARDGGSPLKQRATASLKKAINEIALSENKRGLARAFSLRHEMPSEWHKFLHPTGTPGTQSITLELNDEMFPYLFQGRKRKIIKVEVFIRSGMQSLTLKLNGEDPKMSGAWQSWIRAEPKIIPSDPFKLQLVVTPAQAPESNRTASNMIKDIVILCQYTI